MPEPVVEHGEVWHCHLTIHFWSEAGLGHERKLKVEELERLTDEKRMTVNNELKEWMRDLLEDKGSLIEALEIHKVKDHFQVGESP